MAANIDFVCSWLATCLSTCFQPACDTLTRFCDQICSQVCRLLWNNGMRLNAATYHFRDIRSGQNLGPQFRIMGPLGYRPQKGRDTSETHMQSCNVGETSVPGQKISQDSNTIYDKTLCRPTSFSRIMRRAHKCDRDGRQNCYSTYHIYFAVASSLVINVKCIYQTSEVLFFHCSFSYSKCTTRFPEHTSSSRSQTHSIHQYMLRRIDKNLAIA